MLAAMAVIMAAAAAIGAVHMVVMIVVTVLMAAVLVMHMSLVVRLLPVRVGVVGILLLGRCSGSRGFARGCQSLFMRPSAACSVKSG
ncbi:hypothetical protein CSE6_011_21590 [Comamonas sp. E6]|nr:hypothetical protein CSE6_011_21590 [Comamonas sp. E6]